MNIHGAGNIVGWRGTGLKQPLRGATYQPRREAWAAASMLGTEGEHSRLREGVARTKVAVPGETAMAFSSAGKDGKR